MIEFLANLLISAALLLVVANVVSGVQIDSWGSAIVGALAPGIHVAGFGPALWGSLLLTLLNLGVGALLGSR